MCVFYVQSNGMLKSVLEFCSCGDTQNPRIFNFKSKWKDTSTE